MISIITHEEFLDHFALLIKIDELSIVKPCLMEVVNSVTSFNQRALTFMGDILCQSIIILHSFSSNSWDCLQIEKLIGRASLLRRHPVIVVYLWHFWLSGRLSWSSLLFLFTRLISGRLVN